MRYPTRLTGIVAAWMGTVAWAQAPPFANPPVIPPPFTDSWDGAMERLFEQWTTETPEERRRLDAIEVTEAEEKQIGQERLEMLRRDLASRQLTLLSDGKDVEYLRALVKPLLRQLENQDRYREVQVYVVPIDDTEAGALPGGILIVTRGLLQFAPSEAAIVGVLAHELAHIDHGHQLEDVRRMKMMEQTVRGGTAQPFDFATMGMSLAKRFARPFRPEQETQADADATRWTWQAGYDPRQMADLFDRLHERDAGRQGDQIPSFMRSHPYHWERSRAIREQSADWMKQRRRGKLYVGRTNLARRIPRDERRFLE